MGKSFSVIEWAENTGRPLTVLTSRHELYGQYEEWCEVRDLTYLTLPAFHRECPSAQDGSEYASDVHAIYESGISGAELHNHAKRYFGQPLPCQQEGQCPYMEKRDFAPEEYDVLIGHYLQAHNENYIEERYVAYDEFPGNAYFFEPTHNDATRAITNYLGYEDDLPFRNWKDLSRNRYRNQDAISEWKEDMGFYSHRDSRVALQRNADFHAHAPLLTHAELEFELLENEWEHAGLGAGRVAVKSPEDEWTVLLPPALHSAESVVALDGTPSVTKWRLILGGNWIEHEEVLESDSKKREYLREVLGLEIIQTEAGSKPYQSGVHVNVKSDGALLEGIHDTEEKYPEVITSKKAREEYDSTGVTQLIEGAEHFGNLKGSNQFATSRLGAVIGSPHPPEDEAVERWGAIDGEAVARKEDDQGAVGKGSRLDFGPFGNALFRDVVESEVLQAVMRFGREEDDTGHGATVYVHTSRLPYWVEPDYRVKVHPWSDGMHEVVEVLRGTDDPNKEWTNGEIAEHTSIGTRQVGELMKELDRHDYVSHWRGGTGNAYHWSGERLEDFTAYGYLKLAS